MFIAEETIILTGRGRVRAAPAIVPCPAQAEAARELLQSLFPGSVSVLRAGTGAGRTTVLAHIHAATGGAWLGMREFIDALMLRRPDAIEQAFVEVLEPAIENHAVVFLDDLHLITAITNRRGYERRGLLDAALEAVLTSAGKAGKKMLFGMDTGRIPPAVRARADVVEIRAFEAGDYAAIARGQLGQRADAIDFDRVFRAAPELHAHQIARAARSGASGFVGPRARQAGTAPWGGLRGMDDVIGALEEKIVLPLENRALAAELALGPKRGLLLTGPSGTGKTAIGRGLARRLRERFFLADGTAIASSSVFPGEMARLFDRARKNSPSAIFIDDADAIAEAAGKGFFRCLRTMFDSLDDPVTERVCVILTATDAGRLPRSLLRSGRLELRLETRLPDEAAREAMLRDALSQLPAPMAAADPAALAAASRNLTGADLLTVVEDGKRGYAYDMANRLPARPVDEYFLRAIREVGGHH